MKKWFTDEPTRILYALAVGLLFFAALVSAACGTQMPTQTSTDVNMERHINTQPVRTATSAEPPDVQPVYVTIAPLNVRSCASVNCDKIADIPKGERLTLFITDPISGGGCTGGGWLAITEPKSGFVCSLYVEER